VAERFKIAIVGSGPGGKSAAARAAELGVSHVLLEASPHLSYTIFRYQKGKHVMDEPGVLPLRSPLAFKAGTREAILDAWNQGIESLKTNVKFRRSAASRRPATASRSRARMAQRSRPNTW
jgi:flavin-dependent dehydrogenase